MSTADPIGRETLGDRLRRFFYTEEVPYGLALLRIVMPLILMYPMLPRWAHVREFYSTDGATTPLWIQYGYARMLPEFSGDVAVALYAVMLFCFVTSCVGFMTRASLATAFVLYTYFNLVDSISTMTKYSVIVSHVLLLLSLSRCGAVWSIDAWRSGFGRRARIWPGAASRDWPSAPVWPRRLIQLMIGSVYFGAAVTKLHTPTFFSGDQLRYWMISNINFANPLGEYASQYPALIVAGCYVTIIWEILFVFLSWRGFGRRVMLSLGVMFHFLTFLTLGLHVFPMVSVAIYLAFLNEDDVRAFSAAFRRRLRRWGFARRGTSVPSGAGLIAIPEALRLPAPAVFALAGSLAVFAGLAHERWMDLYGERRPEGPHTLRELDPDRVQAMLAPTRPIRLADKIFSFDVGQWRIGGNLARRKGDFRPGEHLTAEVAMNPPFEDIWMECHLHDAESRPVALVGQSVVSREMMRMHFCYTVPASMEPGRYWIVLSCAGQEVERRPITIHGAASRAPLAN